MSWILAAAHVPQAALCERAENRPDAPLYEGRTAQTYVAAGGHAATCLHGTLPPDCGWTGFVVVGVGLMRSTHVRTLGGTDWASRLAAAHPPLADLDGHFVALRWRDGDFEAFTDRAGLRTAYVTQTCDGVIFSTHLDRLLAVRGGGTLDVTRLGSAWLLHNQVAPVSLVREVTRLMPGMGVAARADGFTLQGMPWQPEPSGEPIEDVLRAHLSPILPGGRRISLGLSGGLDSRLLLALAPEPPALHVFGPPDHPDARIARKVAAQIGTSIRPLHDPLPDADTCIGLATQFATDAQFTAPASAAIQRRYYSRLDAEGYAVFDGGFGEIGRRQFLNRMLVLGRGALQKGHFEALAPYLRVGRPDVFDPSVRGTMQRGVTEDLQALAESGLFAPTRPLADALDRFAIRARLPNAYAFEQTRLDGMGICLMPYAQPSFLQAVLGTPLSERRSGRHYRRLIRALQPSLTRVSLVKGTQLYPFRLGPLGAAAWTHLSSRFRTPYASPGPHALLERIAPFVREAVLPTALATGGLYDPAALTALVEGYYAGNRALAAPLDAWLAFELWRSALGLR